MMCGSFSTDLESRSCKQWFYIQSRKNVQWSAISFGYLKRSICQQDKIPSFVSGMPEALRTIYRVVILPMVTQLLRRNC